MSQTSLEQMTLPVWLGSLGLIWKAAESLSLHFPRPFSSQEGGMEPRKCAEWRGASLGHSASAWK